MMNMNDFTLKTSRKYIDIHFVMTLRFLTTSDAISLLSQFKGDDVLRGFVKSFRFVKILLSLYIETNVLTN